MVCMVQFVLLIHMQCDDKSGRICHKGLYPRNEPSYSANDVGSNFSLMKMPATMMTCYIPMGDVSLRKSHTREVVGGELPG